MPERGREESESRDRGEVLVDPVTVSPHPTVITDSWRVRVGKRIFGTELIMRKKFVDVTWVGTLNLSNLPLPPYFTWWGMWSVVRRFSKLSFLFFLFLRRSVVVKLISRIFGR